MALHWIRLLRVAGLTTIISNLLAAVVTSGMAPLDLLRQVAQVGTSALWVMVASCLLYFAGMIWNDVADAERDQDIAPSRPLPSGRIAYAQAWLVGTAVALVALLCAAQLGWRGFYAGGLVLLLALSYNFGGKQVPWLGSILMAATRGMHALFALLILGNEHFDYMLLLILGLVQGDSSWNLALTAYPVVLAVYIFGLTLVSELEHRHSYRWEMLIAAGFIASALLLAVGQAFTSHLLSDFMVERQWSLAAPLIVGIVTLGGWTLYRLGQPLFQAIRLASRQLIPTVMIRGLSGIILFDALMVLSHQPLMAIPIVFLLIPFKILGQLGRMD